MKIAYLTLSVVNRWGQQIFATLDDLAGKERYRIFKPEKREYWKGHEIQDALSIVSHGLERKGYSIQIVSLEEYNQLTLDK